MRSRQRVRSWLDKLPVDGVSFSKPGTERLFERADGWSGAWREFGTGAEARGSNRG